MTYYNTSNASDCTVRSSTDDFLQLLDVWIRLAICQTLPNCNTNSTKYCTMRLYELDLDGSTPESNNTHNTPQETTHTKYYHSQKITGLYIQIRCKNML